MPWIFWPPLIVLALVALGALYQAIGLARDRVRYPAPGKLHGGLHVQTAGAGAAVVFEAGISASCLNWTGLFRTLEGEFQVCRYDRAGLGWSELSGEPLTARGVVDRMRAALEQAGVARPYLLVGHSFGGMMARHHAYLYPEEVAGLVLIDPLLPEEWMTPGGVESKMLERASQLSRRGALLARLGVVRFALALAMSGRKWLPSTISKVSSGGAGVAERLVGEVRKMPQEVWPMIRAHWCDPKSFEAMAQHLEALPRVSTEVAGSRIPRELPLVVFAAKTAHPLKFETMRALAAQSARGRFVVAENSGHWVHLDEPELVLAAIREMAVGGRSAAGLS